MFNVATKMALALTVIVGMSAASSAQSIIGTPMAGSAGAGNSAINGIPPGPANLGIRSDPSGVRNASGRAAAALDQRPDDHAISLISSGAHGSIGLPGAG